MSNYPNASQPPAAPPPLPVYATPNGYQYQPQMGPWRDGMMLVTTTNAVLPDVCVKCNAPANGYKLRRQMAWHESWLYALILAGVVVYAVVAMVMQKKATIHLGLCPVHRAKRTRTILIAWGIALLALAVGIGGAMLVYENRSTRDFTGLAVVAGIVLLIVAAVVGSIGARVLKPSRIDDHFAWFKGVHPDFLSMFPSTR
jgi:hypothetical protein